MYLGRPTSSKSQKISYSASARQASTGTVALLGRQRESWATFLQSSEATTREKYLKLHRSKIDLASRSNLKRAVVMADSPNLPMNSLNPLTNCSER